MKASNPSQKPLRNRRRIRLRNPALIQNPDKLVMNGLGTTQLVLDENESMMKRMNSEQGVKLRVVNMVGRNIDGVERFENEFEIAHDDVVFVSPRSANDVVRRRHALNERNNLSNII